MLDTLLLDLASVCRQLLPILGALALLFLCMLLRRLWIMIDALTVTVKNLDPAVKSVNVSMDKLQAPLDTVIKYSHTLDEVHDKAIDGVQKISDSTASSVDKVMNFVTDKIKSSDTYDAVMPYKPEENKEETNHE
jgi:hypothetical protein